MLTATEARDLYANEQYVQLISVAEEAIKSAAPNDTQCVIQTSDKRHAPRLTNELLQLGYGVYLEMLPNGANLTVSWR